MIEEMAKVQSVSGQWVSVLTMQTSGCNKCSEAKSCSTSILSKFFANKEIKLNLQSDLSLKAGDEVMLGIKESVFLGLTGLVYLVPLCALFICAVLGEYLSQSLGIESEWLTILFAIAGFVGCFLWIKNSALKFLPLDKVNPVILKKL